MNIAKQAKLIAKYEKRDGFINRTLKYLLASKISRFIKYRKKDLNIFLIKFCLFVTNYPQYYKQNENKFRYDCENFFVEITTISNDNSEYILQVYTKGEKLRRADITFSIFRDPQKTRFNYLSESISYNANLISFTETEIFEKMIDTTLRVLADMVTDLILNNKIFYIY